MLVIVAFGDELTVHGGDAVLDVATLIEEEDVYGTSARNTGWRYG